MTRDIVGCNLQVRGTLEWGGGKVKVCHKSWRT